MNKITCCVAYEDTAPDGKRIHVSFCGKTDVQMALYPPNADCKECRGAVFKLVGTDYEKLNDVDGRERIIKANPRKPSWA